MTRGSEIKRVVNQGKRLRTRFFEVRILASPLVHPRVGFVIPKYSYTAVRRNLLKRRLREIVRVELLATLPAIDVVIKSQPAAYAVAAEFIARDLRQIVSEIPRQFP